MKTIFTELQSRGSLTVDRLIFTSGLYCLVTNADYYSCYDGSAESAVECGRMNGICTAGLNPFHTGRGLSTSLRDNNEPLVKSLNPFHTGRGLSTIF